MNKGFFSEDFSENVSNSGNGEVEHSELWWAQERKTLELQTVFPAQKQNRPRYSGQCQLPARGRNCWPCRIGSLFIGEWQQGIC